MAMNGGQPQPPEPEDLGEPIEYFKTQEELDAYTAGDTIKCLICGREVGHITNHVRLKHGITNLAYREKYGIPRKFPLMPKTHRDRIRKEFTERLAKDPRLQAQNSNPDYLIEFNRRTNWAGRKEKRLELEKAKVRGDKHPKNR